jgi:hypothetical protein
MPARDPYEPEGCPQLTNDDVSQLVRWRPPATDELPAPSADRLFRSAYLLNVQRLAMGYGSKIIAMLVREGYLKPGEDPVRAMEQVLRKAEMFDDLSNGSTEEAEEDPDEA